MSYYNADFFPQSIAYFSWIIQKLLVHYQKKLLLKNKIYSYILMIAWLLHILKHNMP